jgi:hypothetical protein
MSSHHVHAWHLPLVRELRTLFVFFIISYGCGSFFIDSCPDPLSCHFEILSGFEMASLISVFLVGLGCFSVFFIGLSLF